MSLLVKICLVDRLTIKSSALSYGFIPQGDISTFGRGMMIICTDQLRSINIYLSRETYIFFFYKSNNVF